MNKIQNTLENKAKFFALYWGQIILTQGYSKPHMIKGSIMDIIFIEDYLELTPLSKIKDEDVEFVKTNDGYSGSKICKEHVKEHSDAGVLTSLSVDYLRSKGYALPWMDLSVEDLVYYGWLKLKS